MTIELTRAFSGAKLQIFSDTAKFYECNFLYFTSIQKYGIFECRNIGAAVVCVCRQTTRLAVCAKDVIGRARVFVARFANV